jgi:hypothetical protein
MVPGWEGGVLQFSYTTRSEAEELQMEAKWQFLLDAGMLLGAVALVLFQDL